MPELKIGNSCDKCTQQAKIVIPYGPHRFCTEHFNHFFEDRARKTIRTNELVKYGEKIAVGVSGGKDSIVTLHLLNKMFGKTRRNKIEAIMIDEGIHGYRDRALEVGVAYCTAHNIAYHIMTFESELGINTEEVMKKITEGGIGGGTCSFCGVFRRQLLNKKALEIKADKLATGHNMDDEAQSIVMNLFSSDFSRLARIGEIAGNRHFSKFVPRIKPLYDTPEKEIIAYAAFNGIKHYSEECCPYSWTAKRNHFRKMLNEMENQFPGTKHGIMASFRKLKPTLIESESVNAPEVMECTKCGEISNSQICSTCSQFEKLQSGVPFRRNKESPAAQDSGSQSSQKRSSASIASKKENGLSCAITKGTV